MKTTIKPIHLFAPIERVNDDERTITAYAFRNEVVDGEGGVRLRRTAMEAATDDYMQWANIRRMHQPDPVGVAQAVEWDDKGALMTLRVQDDDAWNKVKAGVYKGLSVGVLPRVMRGREVTACKWFETSLVDRPKDTDCNFLVVRAEGVDPEAAVEVEVEDAPEERAEGGEQVEERGEDAPAEEPEEEQRGETITLPADWTAEDVEAFNRWAGLTPNSAELARALTSSDVPSRENLEGPKGDTHYSCGAEGICHGHTTRGGAQECMERQDQGLDQHISALEEHLEGLKAKRRAELGGDAIERGAPAKKDDGHDSPPEGYPESKAHYADPTNYKYPIDTAEHVRAAWSYIHQARNREGYSDEELSFIEARIRKAAEKFDVELQEKRGEEADLPDAETASPTDLLARVDALPADRLPTFTTTILTRLEAAESGLATERQLRTAAEERAEALAKQPAVVAPVRFPQALARMVHASEQQPDLAKLDAEIQRAEADGLAARDKGDEAEALRCVDRFQRLKMQRAALVALS